MIHRKAKKLLSAYLDGELELRQAEEISSHIKHCKECSDIFRDLQKNQQLVENLRQKAPEMFWKSVERRLTTDRNSAPLFPRLWKLDQRTFGIAGVVAMLIILSIPLVMFFTVQTVHSPLEFYLTTHAELIGNPFMATVTSESYSNLGEETWSLLKLHLGE